MIIRCIIPVKYLEIIIFCVFKENSNEILWKEASLWLNFHIHLDEMSYLGALGQINYILFIVVYCDRFFFFFRVMDFNSLVWKTKLQLYFQFCNHRRKIRFIFLNICGILWKKLIVKFYQRNFSIFFLNKFCNSKTTYWSVDKKRK